MLDKVEAVQVITLEAMPAVGMAHTGPYMDVGPVFEKLVGWAISNQAFQASTRMFGLYHDDPSVVPVDQLRSEALIVGSAVPADGTVTQASAVPGGTYAMYLHKGECVDLTSVYIWLYEEWLPQSGYEPGEGPCVEEYLNSPKDVPPEELLTHIFIPLKV